MEELWITEYRYRDRSNGKWSKWESTESSTSRSVHAYTEYPAGEVFAHTKYERSAVKFIRAAPSETGGNDNDCNR